MSYRTHIKEIDEAGFITFTRDELKNLLIEQYERGYNDGVYSMPPETFTTQQPPIIKLIQEEDFIN